MADDKKNKGEQPGKPSKGEKTPKAEGSARGESGSKGSKGSRKAKSAASEGTSTNAVVSSTVAVPPRTLEKYRALVVPALTKQFKYKNPMQVPRLQKIVLNMGLGAAVANPKIMDTAVEELIAISGQKPVVTRARKAIANFKLRAGLPIGAMVTLRRARMWEFFDRLVTVALPRTRDFKGVSRKAFDGKGNYTLGLREQIIFAEVNYDKIDAIKGLNISFVTTAKTDEEGRALLQQLGMPFRAT
jgi:large subunit ribosomal protein L5